MAKKKEIAQSEEVKKEKTSKKPSKKAIKETKEVKKSSKKVEEVKKPQVKEATAKALSVKVTPRKARLVADLVRGKDVEEALEILFNTHKEASSIVAKVIKSASANATNNFGLNEDKLYVASIQVGDSIKMRRFLPRAKGSASGMVKRFSNIYVTVKERD